MVYILACGCLTLPWTISSWHCRVSLLTQHWARYSTVSSLTMVGSWQLSNYQLSCLWTLIIAHSQTYRTTVLMIIGSSSRESAETLTLIITSFKSIDLSIDQRKSLTLINYNKARSHSYVMVVFEPNQGKFCQGMDILQLKIILQASFTHSKRKVCLYAKSILLLSIISNELIN